MNIYVFYCIAVLQNLSLLTSKGNLLGPLGSRAAKAIGFIDTMIEYSIANAPLQKELSAGKLRSRALIMELFLFPWAVFLV